MGDREEMPFNRATRAWVYREAKDEGGVIGFGSTNDLREPGSIIFVNAPFPVLEAEELARMRRFGEVRHYHEGARLFETGKPAAGMFVVLAGAIRIMRHDGLGHELPLVQHGVGEFTAEVGQLSGTPSFVDGIAHGEVEVLLITPERLRALMIAEADSPEARFTAPAVTKAETIHLILTVTDHGAPPLSRYQRVVVTVDPR